MKKLITKTAKLLLAVMIPSMFLLGCNEDVIDPVKASPPKGTWTTPK